MKRRKPANPDKRGREKKGAPCAAVVAARVRAALHSRANSEKEKSGRGFFKEPVILLGVSATESRNLAREIYEEVKKSWSWREAIALADLLLPDPYLEVKGVAILILGRFVNSAAAADLLSKAKSWLQSDFCNNWASVDTLCPEVIAPLLARTPGLLKQVQDWPSSRNRWVKRASAVSLIPLARRGIELNVAYANARRLFTSPDDLIQKANGWLLREAGKTDIKRLEGFLLAHGPAIPRTTLRYAIERFPASRRKYLLRATQG
jgi:3-methyladenine DNA glycosylase AlkD